MYVPEQWKVGKIFETEKVNMLLEVSTDRIHLKHIFRK